MNRKERIFSIEQLDENGNLGPVKDICLATAEQAFIARSKLDTNPSIVQMILRGERIPHWYYRSDEFIDQPFYVPAQFLMPYRGPSNLANQDLYGTGTFVVDKELTRTAKKLL